MELTFCRTVIEPVRVEQCSFCSKFIMRNLKLQYRKKATCKVSNTKFLLQNPNATQINELYLVADAKLHALEESGVLKDLGEFPDVVGAEYLALENTICLATGSGEVLTVNPQTLDINEGTFCAVGIECMAWSPDQEVVAFVTKERHVVVMTCTFDVISEHVLADACSGEGQFVNVGWGKKETQFHGSEGKMAAKQKQVFKPTTDVKTLPQNIEITWRGDCAYFAVSFVSDEVGRMFKVFNKEGQLCYTSEKLNGLEPPVAWRASGNWIAMPQQLSNKCVVSLFEKNGLRHREIVLPFDFTSERIKSLKWNYESDVLAIETERLETNQSCLYLYTIGNYHWYLKQTLLFKEKDSIAVYNWDNRIGEERTMHVMTVNGNYFVYRWCYAIDLLGGDDTVGVIDGQKLLITCFAEAVVPPPMCSYEITLAANINACTAYRDDETNTLQLCIYDADHRLHIYESASNSKTFTAVSVCIAEEYVVIAPLEFGNIFYFSHACVLATTSTHNSTKVLCILIDEEKGALYVDDSFEIDGIVSAVCNGCEWLEQFFVQLTDGRLQVLGGRGALKQDKWQTILARPADHLLLHPTDKDPNALVALKTNQNLYYGSKCIANDVTSCCLAGKYLAYTKLTMLYFWSFEEQRNVYERKIERGGKLITIILKDGKTVLQMPRGNLEVIYPRVLVLAIIGELLKHKQYNSAMDVLRKQRINLNIICDHNMNAFVENIDVFLRDVKNPNWLNLFLTDLQNEDFTKAMYASNYKEGSQVYPKDFKISHKVEFLCEKLCERMEQSKDARFHLPLITAYVKLQKVEKALDMIWQEKIFELLKNSDAEANGGESVAFPVPCTGNAEEALKYLLYLVDVNELYNVALGTYDFGLVLFVAQKSQKDPKEYLPFLNELKKLEINYRKFKIDEYLKHYEKALGHIVNSDAERFPEALKFIENHKLYQVALDLYESQPEAYKEICLSYADYLRANGKLANASIMYERADEQNQAFMCAKNALDWQRAVVLAKKLFNESQEFTNVVQSLASLLQERGRYEEAFQLLKTYGNDVLQSLKCLLQGKLFLQLLFEARMQKSEAVDDFLYNTALNELNSYSDTLRTKLETDQGEFLNHKYRLLKKRADKANAKQQNLEAEAIDDFIDECDLLSDTTSMRSSRFTGSSQGTGKTFRSSKNRRKHERKVLSLKPGNPFEEIALIDVLYNQIKEVTNQQQHIYDTCKALIELKQDLSAKDLQHAFKAFLMIIKDSLDDIWNPEMLKTQQFITAPTIDYTQLQDEQRYALLEPIKRFKPQLNLIDWEHEILR